MGDLFDYHYGTEAEQYSYFRVPHILITDERFKAVSTDAKLLAELDKDIRHECIWRSVPTSRKSRLLKIGV